MNSLTKDLIGKVLNSLCAGSFILAVILNERLNDNELLGCLVVWAILAFLAMALFWSDSLPFWPHLKDFPFLRHPFWVSIFAVLFAVLEIPIWSLMTGQFPPDDFTSQQASIVTAGVLFGMAGPAAPAGINFIRNVWDENRKQRQRIKDKKRSQHPGAR